MVFILSKVLWLIVRPSVLAVLLVAFGFWRARRVRVAPGLGTARVRLPGRRLMGLGIGYYLAVLILPLHVWVAQPLEDRFPSPALPDHVDGIVVLGGAIDEILTQDRGQPALNERASRMTEAVALSRRYPDAVVVFSGGSGRVLTNGITESDAARQFFVAMGVPEARLKFEDRSRNTEENASFTKALAAPEPGQTWLLVTSAMHMPRSMGLFRHLGWQMMPWPTAYTSGHSVSTWYHATFPQRLQVMDQAVHEYVGLVVARLRGETDRLLPAPKG